MRHPSLKASLSPLVILVTTICIKLSRDGTCSDKEVRCQLSCIFKTDMLKSLEVCITDNEADILLFKIANRHRF